MQQFRQRMSLRGTKRRGNLPVRFLILLVQRESNTHRISAALFGSFGLVVLALRQQVCVLRTQNSTSISRRNVRSSFDGADFRPDEKLDAGNTLRIAKDNCDVWAEIRPAKPMRVRLPLD